MDRETLIGRMDDYLAAVAASDPTALSCAPGFRYTENAATTPPGEGLWRLGVRFGGIQSFADSETGQVVCMASGRHIVHRKIADDYIELLARKAKALPVGDPYRAEVAIGPIINSRQIERVHKIVGDSVAAGAELAAGGTYDGLFYQPTVLAKVTSGMPAYELEIFGPVAPVIVVADEEEAIRVANDTEYGLSGAVQTGSLERGLRVAQQIRSGLVHINDQTIHDMAGIPFGGSGASGNGSRFGSTTNLDEFTEWQWMTIGGQPVRYPF